MKNKKRTIIEIVLGLIILLQFGVIYFLYNVAEGRLFKDALDFMEEMGCVETAGFILDYYENDQFEAVIGLGEYLYKNGFEDKFTLHLMAEAHFITGNAIKAAEYLEEALETGYLCKIVKPSLVKSRELEEAIARYQLSEIYYELDSQDKAKKELIKAHDIFKRIYGKRYTPDIAEKMFLHSSFKKARKKFLDKKESDS